jgi:DNA end-binding protein Ku
MWKGELHVGGTRLPVKLYSAVKERGVRFRMLHAKDHEPIRQHFVNAQTDEIVPWAATRRALPVDDGQLVVLTQDEIESLAPPASRTIEVARFLPAGAIDHRWYDRPYYLGPDGDATGYAALVEALKRTEQEGLAHWVMRKQAYTGALRLRGDHAALITLHPAEQVVMAGAIDRSTTKRTATKGEIAMAKQLVGMLEGEFDPAEYTDEYRERVMDLIRRKASGKTIRLAKPPRAARRTGDLSAALKASLARERKVA